MAIFGFHPVECRLVEQRAAVPGFTFSFMKNQAIGHALGVVFLSFFLWSLVRFNCARNSGVDDVSRLQGCEMKAEGL